MKKLLLSILFLSLHPYIYADPEDYDVPYTGDYDGMKMPDPSEDFNQPKNQNNQDNQNYRPYSYNPYYNGYIYPPPMIIQNFSSPPPVDTPVPQDNSMNRKNGFNAPLPPGQGFNAKPVPKP